MSNKEIQQEGLFGTAKKLSDAFLDGLKNNAVDSVLATARKARLERETIEKMEKIKKEKQELDKLLKKDAQLQKYLKNNPNVDPYKYIKN